MTDNVPPLTLIAERLATARVAPDSSTIERWARLCRVASTRAAIPAEAPLLTVVVGPTGAGKSTIFNLLFAETLSEASAIRPCTKRPFAVGTAGGLAQIERDPTLGTGRGELDAHTLDSTPFPRQIVVDTPDFDSVETENRRRAEWLILRADRVLFVTTPEKYGDASVWETIDLLTPLGSIAAVVFNKADAGASLEDFRRLLEDRDLTTPIAVPRAPEIADPSSDAGATPTIRQQLRQALADPDDPTALRARLAAAADHAERELRLASVEPWLLEADAALTDLAAELTRLRDDLLPRVQRELALEVDSALRRELEARFRDQVQRIDILREPRRWLTAPVAWIGQWFSGASEAANDGPTSTADWLARAYRDRFDAFALQVAEDVSLRVDRTLGERRSTFQVPHAEAPDAETTRRRLDEVFADLEATIRRETEAIADGLPMSGKVGFYGSQVLFHTLFAAACVKTGGLLSVTEVATQGLVSPFIAKVLGHYVSSQEASAVEERLRSEFAEAMREAVLPVLEPIQTRLDELREIVPTADVWRRSSRAWESSPASRIVSTPPPDPVSPGVESAPAGDDSAPAGDEDRT